MRAVQVLRPRELRDDHWFDHLPPAQLGYVAHGWSTIDSPFADLSRGFEAYDAELRQRGQTVAQVRRKERKLAREVGPLRFEMHATHKDVFDFLLAWKSRWRALNPRAG
jgi:hypothetical protein